MNVMLVFAPVTPKLYSPVTKDGHTLCEFQPAPDDRLKFAMWVALLASCSPILLLKHVRIWVGNCWQNSSFIPSD